MSIDSILDVLSVDIIIDKEQKSIIFGIPSEKKKLYSFSFNKYKVIINQYKFKRISILKPNLLSIQPYNNRDILIYVDELPPKKKNHNYISVFTQNCPACNQKKLHIHYSSHSILVRENQNKMHLLLFP